MNLYYISCFLGTKSLHFAVFANTNRKGGDVYKKLEDYLIENCIPYDRLGFAFFQRSADPGLFDDIVTPISSSEYFGTSPLSTVNSDLFTEYLQDPEDFISPSYE